MNPTRFPDRLPALRKIKKTGMRRRRVSTVWFCALACWASATWAKIDPCDEPPKRGVVRIGLLHHSTSVAGETLKVEARRVLDSADWGKESSPPCLIDGPYPTEQIGFQILDGWREQKAVELVIGPTDSGVFFSALHNEEKFAQAGLTVVSPIVAARFQTESEWLFHTNLSVVGRFNEMMGLLEARGVRSVGILHDSTRFGLSAQQYALEASENLDWFQSARFEERDDLQTAVKSLLAGRPAAIGIVASRKDIEEVHEAIEARNRALLNPYDPYLFSLIDVRPLKIPDLEFVSVGDKLHNELSILSRDATRDVVGAIRRMGTDVGPEADEWRKGFQQQIAGMLGQAPLGFRGEAKILALEGKSFVLREASASQWERATRRARVLTRRWGYLPGANILLLVGLVVLLSRQDLRKWNHEGKLSWRTRWGIWRVVFYNTVVAVAVFLTLTAMGLIEWSTLLGAVTVGVGYPALLKSTIAQTKAGEALGFAKRYDDYLRALNDKIMVAKYRSRRQIVDFIAMTNGVLMMKETLTAIYAGSSEIRRGELNKSLDEELDAAEGLLAKRIALARRIERTLPWDVLVDRKFVPPIRPRDLIGPEEILQVAVEHCDAFKDSKLAAIKKVYLSRVKSRVEGHPGRNLRDYQNEVNDWLKHAESDAGDMRAYLRWIFIQDRFRIKKIVDMGYLPEVCLGWTRAEWIHFGRRELLDTKTQKDRELDLRSRLWFQLRVWISTIIGIVRGRSRSNASSLGEATTAAPSATPERRDEVDAVPVAQGEVWPEDEKEPSSTR